MCCALVRISGLDLAIMQVEAWAEMIHQRSEQGVAQAVYSTLSGDSPCEKCLHVKEQRKEQERNKSTFTSLNKLKLPHYQNPQEIPEDLKAKDITLRYLPYLTSPSRIYLSLECPPPRV